MAVGNQTWEHWLERVYDLRRDKRGSHERPHKSVLLLSIIDLLDRGVRRENAVPLPEELVRSFTRYFVVVRVVDTRGKNPARTFLSARDSVGKPALRSCDHTQKLFDVVDVHWDFHPLTITDDR